jgi:hypothetical protein
MHGRTAFAGQVVFRDRDGNFYRDLDVKGIGYIGSSYSGDRLKAGAVERPGPMGEPGTAHGIATRSHITNDRNFSEMFLRVGIRTYRYIAITELGEIVDEGGRKISIQEAINRGIIDEETQPVIALRAWGTRMRIEDLRDTSDCEKNIEDARILVAQELGKKPSEFTQEEYLKWFVSTLGEQVAKMHRRGWRHKYLTEHNITLDCRIVDLDSVEDIHKDAENEKLAATWDGTTEERVNRLMVSDCNFTKSSLGSMMKYGYAWEEKNMVPLFVLFDRSYQAELSKGAMAPTRYEP